VRPGKCIFIAPPTVHNVIAGDNLSRIAADYLGDPQAWREIAELNNIDNPLRLDPGTTLILPAGRRKTLS
jgi:nucleoid-associated protein YgaU